MKSQRGFSSKKPSDSVEKLKNYQEKIKLYKIIKGSARIQTARKMFGLQKEEYVVQFVNNQTKIRDANGKEKIKKMSAETKDDFSYFSDVIEVYVKKDIVEYFQLQLPVQSVIDAIFKAPFIPQSFIYSSAINKKTGYFQITLQFLEILNAANTNLLIRKIKEDMRFLEEFHRTNNTQGLNTRSSSFKQIKKIPFDQQYQIYQEYRKASAQNKKISRHELENLVSMAKAILNKTAWSGFNIKDLRKIVKDFREYFYC